VVGRSRIYAVDIASREATSLLTATDGSLSTSLAEILATAIQELIEAELTARIGAEPGERTPARVSQADGPRSAPQVLSTPHSVQGKLAPTSPRRDEVR
jgi:transposase-like protein